MTQELNQTEKMSGREEFVMTNKSTMGVAEYYEVFATWRPKIEKFCFKIGVF